MHRRYFLTAAATFVGAAALSILPASQSRADDVLDYGPGVLEEALASGKAVLVEYSTDWCSTCRAQQRAVTGLRAVNPAYDENIIFIRVDWDEYRREPIATDYAIPRRSTLVLLKGEEELGRVVAQTSRSSIEELLDLAL